ncbi:hypothetical protein MKW98_006219 [Papaver atlanticum]|uniref:Uncharacterized protein n=1 Tax=Papaver atlanticum TaxID=357466 RepID=A0AAD4TDM6_9MAGN|nr:hypothetical protein MKW98_006219 [Papaver atlanticum]
MTPCRSTWTNNLSIEKLSCAVLCGEALLYMNITPSLDILHNLACSAENASQGNPMSSKVTRRVWSKVGEDEHDGNMFVTRGQNFASEVSDLIKENTLGMACSWSFGVNPPPIGARNPSIGQSSKVTKRIWWKLHGKCEYMVELVSSISVQLVPTREHTLRTACRDTPYKKFNLLILLCC